MSGERVIGVDLGGTKILAGIVDADGSVLESHERPTPLDSQEQLVAMIQDAVAELVDGSIGAIGLGVPSRVDQATGIAHGSVNIPLQELPLRDLLSDRFGLPTEVENDGNAAALAEWTLGAGRGSTDMVMLTLGTGVGGGVVIGGRLYRGWAELGHVVVEYGGKPCQGICTGRGHLESYCTGVAAGELAEQVFGPGADAHRLVDLARVGDERAIELLAQVGGRLGAGIGSFVNIWNPQVVVVGGGFGAAARELLLGPASETLRREALAPAGATPIVPAELGSEAGLIGAALVGLQALETPGVPAT